jgi:hypothetical protein
MGSNTSGAENTSVGYLSMSNNTTGSNNAALGRRALWGNTTTSNNVAIGYFALDDVLTAGNNTAVGANALGAATGGNNTALGGNAGLLATTGANNTFLGFSSGSAVTTGGKNVILGSYTGNSGGLDIRTASNYVVLSDGDGTIRGVFDASGNLLVGLTSATGVAKLQVSGAIRTTGFTVATLPAGTVGMRTYVTDALAPSFGVAVAGSGAVTIPVFYDGANWIVA